jgi:uncharacterized membrane protein YhiD involved in acid resistance
MTSLQYLRYVAYALFAVGIINLRYQSGEEDLGIRTVLIVGTGVVLFALTYFNFGKKTLGTPAGKILAWIAAIAATLFAILN